MECPVCLTIIRSKSKCIINPCNHTLCKGCHKKLKSNICPICRGGIIDLVHKSLDNNFVRVFSLNKWCRVYEKEILMKDLKKHVFSFRFKDYLSHILFNRDNPYITKHHIVSPHWNHDHFLVYKPECISYYSARELLIMLKDNYNKIEFQSNFMHVFVSVCELISAEFTARENDLYFWNVIENSSWFSEESKENHDEIIIN
jgi:hypothetical protein